jgi:hypothetical protein
MMRRRDNAAAQRSQERRTREDAAPRLAREVPNVASLDLVIAERASDVGAETVYTRRVVIAAAPALFEVPCGDPSCEGGGHDLTLAIMRALRNGEVSFTGEDACHGSVRTSSCTRVLRYTGDATYRAKSDAASA